MTSVYKFLIKEDDQPVIFLDFVKSLRKGIKNNVVNSFVRKFGNIEIVFSSDSNAEFIYTDLVDDEVDFYIFYF